MQIIDSERFTVELLIWRQAAFPVKNAIQNSISTTNSKVSVPLSDQSA